MFKAINRFLMKQGQFLSVLGFIVVSATVCLVTIRSAEDAVAASQVEVAQLQKEKRNDEIVLHERFALERFVYRVMDATQTPLAKYDRVSLTIQIVSEAFKKFDKQADRKAWIVLLGIESNFITTAKSRSRAYGLGQVTLPTAQSYAKKCIAVEVFTAVTLFDPLVNLPISACIFSQLLKEHGGHAPALLAYNAGPASRDLANLSDSSKINSESAQYLVKHTYLMEKLAGE